MAVYTKVIESDVAEFLNAYDLGTLQTLAPIWQGIENTNYFVITTLGRYVLTLYEKRVQTEDLPFFIGLMEHLAHKALPCPLPIKKRDGQVLGHLAGRHAALFSFLDGRALSRIAPQECGETGHALAAMHNAVADFKMQRPNILSIDGWEKLLSFSKARADEVSSGLGDLLQEELDYLRFRWPQDLPTGVIHADLFPDNVLFNENGLCGMIDFYFACNDILVYDLAVCLNAWCFENNSAFNITKARALVKGYEQIRPLSEGEKKALPILARGSAMRFLLTRLHDWLNQTPDTFVKLKDPLEYLTKLRFHQMVGDVSAYGFDA